MKLTDAVKHVSKETQGKLSGKDAIAVHALVELARRVMRARDSVRSLNEVLFDNVNQEGLFGVATSKEEAREKVDDEHG